MYFTSSLPKYRGRPSSRPWVGFHTLVFAIFATFALATAVSPASAIPHAIAFFARARLAWGYFCSTLFGAAPFLATGALAAGASTLWKRWNKACVLAPLLLPGCDCTINSLSSQLRTLPTCISAIAVVWGACCNPLALVTTYIVLGPRLMLCRMLCGAAAALTTAGSWTFSRPSPTRRACAAKTTFADAFISAFSHGLGSFSIASAIACSLLAMNSLHFSTTSGVLAAVLGAILSPCSSADSLLARVLFTAPKCQLAFVVAASCFDLRQAFMLARNFGPFKTMTALLSSTGACALGYVLA